MSSSARCEAAAGAPRGSALEVLLAFAKLGTLSFGGPIAHLGYFRAELIDKRRWLTDEQYGDLIALCQFLPGPASSQVAFGLGMLRAGLPGALLASLAFTLPSAGLMIAFGYGVWLVGDPSAAGWLRGLKLAAVVVVAQAVWGMGRSLCPDRARRSIALASAALLLVWSGAGAQVAVLAAGAALGAWLYADQAPAPALATELEPRVGRGAAAAALLTFGALLLVLPALAAADAGGPLAVFDAFYRAGALVFGGGHVVLPLLRAELVPRGWLSDEQFLAGYGAVQAVPGPLFTFAAYLGTAMGGGQGGWQNGLWCLLGIFSPAWLLIGGALPFWSRLRSQARIRAALAGANAAVVGVLLATLYDPVFGEGVRGPVDLAAAFVAFCLLELWRWPPWSIVLLMAAAGQWMLPR